MIMVVSLIALLRGFPCFHNFLHGASHPYIPIALVPVVCSAPARHFYALFMFI